MQKEKNLKEMVRLSPERIVYFLWPYLILSMELKETFRRQGVITHSWEIIVTTEYVRAGIVVWELRIKNVLNALGSIQLSYMQLRL